MHLSSKLFLFVQREYPILFAKLFYVFVFGSVVFIFKLTESLFCKCFRFTNVGNKIRERCFIYRLNFGYDGVEVSLLIAIIVLRTVIIIVSQFCEFVKIYYLKNTISSVPTPIRQIPAKAFFESFSLKTKYEKMTITMMLSLSTGTTTLTSPFWMA